MNLLVYLLFGLLSQQPTPSNQIAGTWINQDPETMGITQIVVRRRGNKLYVHAWGACQPRDCDQGETEINFAEAVGTAVFDAGFAVDQMYLVRLPSGKLLVVDKFELKNNAKQQTSEYVYFFILKEESQSQAAVAARVLLREVAQTYRGLTAAEFEFDSMDERKEKVSTSHVKTTFAEGNRSRTEAVLAGEPETVISDGKTIWTVFSESNEYAISPAGIQPSSVDAYKTIDLMAGMATITGSERVGEKNCTVVTLERPNQVRTLWIDSATNLVVKDRTIIRSSKTREAQSTETIQFLVARPLTDVNNDLFSFDPGRKGSKLRSQLQERALTTSIGKEAPEFALDSIDGKKVQLSDFKGKVVLLDFWATWCTPCRSEMPTIELLNRQFKDKGLVVLGIDDEDAPTQKDYMDKSGFSFASLVEPRKQVTNQFHVGGIPTTVLIDQQGTIRAFDLGESSFEALRASLGKLGLN
ncbi:MAG TPA: redoxin domain-containing protein [Terriglobales bacterium]|nr:redoxin domain-containing protein [Terriglobales bacterium]